MEGRMTWRGPPLALGGLSNARQEREVYPTRLSERRQPSLMVYGMETPGSDDNRNTANPQRNQRSCEDGYIRDGKESDSSHHDESL